MPTLLLMVRLAQAAAPPPCTAPEYRQFDFWLGEWEVRGPKGKLAGTNRITAIENGCALEENWKSAGGGTGRSINAYRPWTKTWHQTWVGADGLVLLLEGRYDGDRMVLEGTSPSQAGPNFSSDSTVLNRITWSRLDGGKVRQFWEQSSDRGKTWTVAFDGTYSRGAPAKE
jgi:hypothetical protein